MSPGKGVVEEIKSQVWLKNRVVLNHVFGWIIGHKTYNPIEAVVLLL